MNIWLFTFTQEAREIVTARVAAPTRAQACQIMGKVVNRPFGTQPNTHPEPGTILQHLGDMDLPFPGLLSAIDTEGRELAV